MSINSSSINSSAINASSTTSILGSGEFIPFEQVVAKIGVGELVSIEQIISLRASTSVSESLIDFEQVTEAQQSGEFILIEQRVRSAIVADHLTRTGWDLTLIIGGYEIPKTQIHGSISINRTESDAALMTLTLIPPIGIQDIDFYQGKTVTLDAHTVAGTRRLFTGIIDIPEIDLIEEKITLRCTDRRTELINSQLANIVSSLGYYSPYIFRDSKDLADEVDQRLTTTPQALDFDPYGIYTITPWFAKSTPDFTLQDDDVYYERPRVELMSRGRITNKVNVNVTYRYERFHQLTRNFTWTAPYANQPCLFFNKGHTMTHKAAVLAAIEAAGWPVKGTVNFTPIMAAGWYNCSGQWVAWGTSQVIAEMVPQTDEDGNQQSDSNGNLLTKAKLGQVINYGDLYCIAASWKANTRWSQYLTENYTLSVSAPQSIAQYGTIEQDLQYGIEQEINADEWETLKVSSLPPGGSDSYYADQDINRAATTTAISVALQQAKTTILGSHRDTRVIFNTFLWPQVDLKHTVLLDTDLIEAKGKVFSINHDLNIGTSEARTTVTLALFRAQGTTTESSLVAPAKPVDSVTYGSGTIGLGNHFGEDPTTPAAASWTGMIGNIWLYTTANTYRTTYQEAFVVDVPAILPALRDAKELAKTATYNVLIPNDTLVITFDGK